MTKKVELILSLLNHWQGCIANQPDKAEMLQIKIDEYIEKLHRYDVDVELDIRENIWKIVESD